jgi:hypothetical protein
MTYARIAVYWPVSGAPTMALPDPDEPVPPNAKEATR